ncbi:MAG TPA: SRPBCC domain-containing protein [Casimicrobiaceae bacterium]|nr:SRPBCC domain-containing protein [Casimicrobiaceae bacterium]
MSGDRIEARITIAGSAEAVWRELTKTDEPQAAVFNAWLHAQALAPGASLQMRTPDGRNVLVVGRILEFDPPRRFAHTFRFTQYDDPPCTVVYEIRPVSGGVEVTLVVENVPPGTRTAKEMSPGAARILAALRQIVETGRPAFATRLLYMIFARLGFVLPARTRTEHWPL